MVIYGWKTYVQVLAVLQLVCGQCGNASEHVLRKLTTKFTLFFIPLFPINKKRTLFCPACEHEQKLPAAQAEQLMATGGMPTQGTHAMLGATPGMPGTGMQGPGAPGMQGPGTPPGMPVPMAAGSAAGFGAPGMQGPGMPVPMAGAAAGPMPGVPMAGPGTPPPGMPAMPGHPGMPGPAMGSGGFRTPGPAPSFAGPMTPPGMPGPGTPPPGLPAQGQFGPGPHGAPPQAPPPGYPQQPPYPPQGYPPHGYGPR